jgi:hypothetical protein
MARAFVSMSNQKFAYLTDALKWRRDRDARSGKLSGGFEGQPGLAVNPLATLHQVFPSA